ncbi:MAG: response regulator [Flavobacteriales bacterium]
MNTGDKLILLVDDDEDDCIFFQEALEELDVPVLLKIAENGMDAIKQLEEQPHMKPDVIFLDINMPVMDGHEFLKYIRSKSFYDDIKIIMYSTSYNPTVAEVLEADGANHFLRKPSNFLTLKDVINRALSIINGAIDNTNFIIAI